MKKSVSLSDRAVGPAVPVSYRKLASRRNGANGNNGISMVDMLSEEQRGETIQVSIVNKSQEDKTFALFPGRLTSVEEIYRYAGVEVDAIAVEGVIKEGDATIATVTSKTLNLAQKWVCDHPTRFCKMKLQCDNEAQFSKEISLSTFSLGKKGGEHSIRPIEFIAPSQLNKTLCDIDVALQLDDACVMVVEVAAGRTLDLSLTIVTEMNLADSLSQIVDKLEY